MTVLKCLKNFYIVDDELSYDEEEPELSEEELITDSEVAKDDTVEEKVIDKRVKLTLRDAVNKVIAEGKENRKDPSFIPERKERKRGPALVDVVNEVLAEEKKCKKDPSSPGVSEGTVRKRPKKISFKDATERVVHHHVRHAQEDKGRKSKREFADAVTQYLSVMKGEQPSTQQPELKPQDTKQPKKYTETSV